MAASLKRNDGRHPDCDIRPSAREPADRQLRRTRYLPTACAAQVRTVGSIPLRILRALLTRCMSAGAAQLWKVQGHFSLDVMPIYSGRAGVEVRKYERRAGHSIVSALMKRVTTVTLDLRSAWHRFDSWR
jgi:hypothetical protein